jgi:hypothetical protein
MPRTNAGTKLTVQALTPDLWPALEDLCLLPCSRHPSWFGHGWPAAPAHTRLAARSNRTPAVERLRATRVPRNGTRKSWPKPGARKIDRPCAVAGFRKLAAVAIPRRHACAAFLMMAATASGCDT